MSVLQDAFSALNPEQKTAVDTTEGPLLVLAGPGTGKTQVVALRVANILKTAQMRPSNILCLTFSVSGATAMRERLRGYIGPDAYGVTITTFHGFCNDLIQRHPEVFHDFSELSQISDVERYRLVNRLIDDLPMDAAIVNPKDRYGRTADILSRISETKREGVTIERLASASKTYAQEMQDKSRPGTKAHERNLKLSRQFDEFIELFDAYNRTLREKALYDYEDMILFVIRALKEEDWLLASLQERFQYVLVDEFQDTNGSQNEIVELLTTFAEGVRQAPNICVVGDDDQAIYRFQGANVTNMIRFRERFPDAKVVTLTKSYRSTQEILDAAKAVITHNTERLTAVFPDIQKDLTSARKDPHGPSPILLRPVSDAVEHFAIAEQIEGLREEGIPIGEIAVFTRTNGELFDLQKILLGRGIPVQLTGKLNLLWHSKVLQVIAMLRAIHKPLEDRLLADSIACVIFGCHPADLGKIWSYQREQTYLRYEEKRPKLALYDVLADIETIGPELHLTDLPTIVKTRDLLFSLIERKASMTLLEMFDTLLHASGMLPNDIGDTAPLDLVALQEFYEHVKLRAHEVRNYMLEDLLSDLDYRIKYNIALTYAIPHIIDEGIQLMTAHGSKGREFEAVIIANFREKHWDHKRGKAKLALPDHLIFGVTDDETLQDERRLTYVALTRAKKQLLLSCPMKVTRGEREQDVSPSQFFSEAGVLPEKKYELKDATRASILLVSDFQTNIDDEMRTFLRKKLETYELSVTALNTFLEDPYRFLWEDLLMLPRSKDPTLAYGTAVHDALYQWGMHAKQGGNVTTEQLLEAFKKSLAEEVITDRDRALWQSIGERALPIYAEQYLREIPLIMGLERKVTAHVKEIPLKGLIDRIDLYNPDGKFLHIVDYKTGRPKTEKLVREERGGAMIRQLTFYKLLIERSPAFSGYEVKETTLHFIGDRDNPPSSLTITVTPQEVRQLEDLIQVVWNKIINLDFTSVDLSVLDAMQERHTMSA